MFACGGGGGGTNDDPPASNYLLNINLTYSGTSYTAGNRIWVDIWSRAADVGDSEADSYIGGEYISAVSGTVSRELASGTYYVAAYAAAARIRPCMFRPAMYWM